MPPPEDVPRIAGALQRILRAGSARTIAQLAAMVRVPSVSWEGSDPRHLEDSASLVAALCERTGVFEQVHVLRHGSGAPAVVARREPAPGKPTVALYAHHDVQPAGEPDQWTSAAFDPVVRSGRLYGRGSADDKAGIAVHLAAVSALGQYLGDELGLGLVAFIEGEEECGSPTFAGFLAEYAHLLASDLIIVADSDNPSTTTPALTTSLRGNVTAVLTVSTLDHPLHSGMFGGAAPDAMMALVRVLDSFYDKAGTLAIAGLGRLADTQSGEPDQLGPEAGLLPGVAEIGGGSVPDRLWRQPALTITGVEAPAILEASNTLLARARAKVSLRVAPGDQAQSALEALRAHIEAHVPYGAHWSLEVVSVGEPFVQPLDSIAGELAHAALEAGFGQPAREQGVGGSIPFISQLQEAFPQAHVLVTGVEDPDTRAHSPNESLDLGVLWRQALSEATLLALLNRRERSDFVADRVVE